jgi:hypothetical protein
MRVAFTFFIVFLFLVSSCTKDEISKEDQLSSGKWQITEYTEVCYCGNINSIGWGTTKRDVYATYAACVRDDYFVFYKGGTVEVNEGPSKCDPAKPQFTTEDWYLNSDATRFSFRGKDWDIVQLNKTTFKITTLVLLGTGETITFSRI